jgi:hypothetical protein
VSAVKLLQRIIRHGVYHPATFASYARAHVASAGRIRPPQVLVPLTHDEWGDMCAAYTTADLRARGVLGHNNRRERRYWSERADRFNREVVFPMKMNSTEKLIYAAMFTAAINHNRTPDVAAQWAHDAVACLRSIRVKGREQQPPYKMLADFRGDKERE